MRLVSIIFALFASAAFVYCDDEFEEYEEFDDNSGFIAGYSGYNCSIVSKDITFFCPNGGFAFFRGSEQFICSDDIWRIVQLDLFEAMHFSNCQLSEIPFDSFPSLENLNTLDISSMELEQMPKELFRGAKRLAHLNVSHNRLDVVRANQFEMAAMLTTVDLSFNNITIIKRNVFGRDLEHLTSLDLSYNQINRIESGTFDFVPHLEYLDLSNNQLETIEIDTFTNTSLNTLDLSFNLFKEIELTAVLPRSISRSIERFLVEGNPLNKICGYTHERFPRLILFGRKYLAGNCSLSLSLPSNVDADETSSIPMHAIAKANTINSWNIVFVIFPVVLALVFGIDQL